MSLRVRKQFPEFEIDEFTDEKELTLDEALTEIKIFEWINESAKSANIIEQHAEPSIWLSNLPDNTLSVCWVENNKFAIYYSTNKLFQRSSTSVVNGLEQVIEIVKLFNGNETDLLLKRLRTSELHRKTLWLLDLIGFFTFKRKTRNSREVIKEEFIYEMKNVAVLKKLTFSILFFIMAPVIWAYSALGNHRPFSLITFLGIQAFLSLLALPGLIITINHWKKNGRWKVYFRKGENIFFIVTPMGKEMLDKSDYTKRIITTNDSNAPWSGYEYTTLIKSNGDQLHFSNLLIPTPDMDKLFERIDETIDKSRFQIIRYKKIKE